MVRSAEALWPNPSKAGRFRLPQVPLDDKQALVDDVFHSVARRYDLMNDLMSGGLHRAWKDALVTAVNPPKTNGAFALLDLAGGTGDVAFRVADAGGPGTRVTVADINTEMLAVGRERTAERGRDESLSSRPMPRSCRCPTKVSTPSPSPSASATCRASTRRSEAHRVLKIGGRFLCLEFSSVDVPALDRLYDLYSFNVIPAVGRAVTGDAEAYRYLVGIDPQISASGNIRRHDTRRRFPPRLVPADDRRRGGAAFRLAARKPYA